MRMIDRLGSFDPCATPSANGRYLRILAIASQSPKGRSPPEAGVPIFERERRKPTQTGYCCGLLKVPQGQVDAVQRGRWTKLREQPLRFGQMGHGLGAPFLGFTQ